MAYQEPVKEFSAERRRKLRQLNGDPEISNADLYRAVQELGQEIAAWRQTQSERPAEPDHGHPDGSESLEIRVEIAQMVRVIGRAKLEIASIKHPMAENDRMDTAATELDAIVLAAEASTQDVLAASEQIEIHVRKIAALCPDDEEMVTISDQIGEEIIKIFEACSFQDLTGQSINKVIKTIRFIEEKILAMIGIWGAEAFMDLPVVGEPVETGDDGLMNGPQLTNQGITQEEINALFD